MYNNALLTANQKRNYEAVRSDAILWGRWVESAVGAHLLSQAEEDDYQVFYWRKNNDEVDYVVSTDDGCVAIEVKSGRRSKNAGMAEFANAYNPQKTYIIGTGGIPLDVFLSTDLSGWL